MKIKTLRKALTLAGLIGISSLYGKAQDLKLEDFQSTYPMKNELIYTVNSNEASTTPTLRTCDFVDLTTALDETTTTTQRKFLLSSPGEYSTSDLPSSVTLVGLERFLVKPRYKTISDFEDPIESAKVNGDLTINNKRNVKLVNLDLRGSVYPVWIENSEDVTLFNNVLKGRNNLNNGGFPYEGALVFLSKNVTLEGNLFKEFYRWMDYGGEEPNFLSGEAVNIGTNFHPEYTVKLIDNIFFRCNIGVNTTDASSINMGKLDTPGNNIFFGNISYNLNCNVNRLDADSSIYAEKNLWFDTLKNKGFDVQYSNLINEIERLRIEDTELKESSLTRLEDITRTIKSPAYTIDTSGFSTASETTRRVYINPPNSYDPLGRIGPIVNAVEDWGKYE